MATNAPNDWLFDFQRLVETGNIAAAESLCNQRLAATPDDPNVLHAAGWIAFQRGRLDEAQRYLQHAIDRQPSALFYNTLGVILRSSNLAASSAAFAKAIELAPQFPLPHANLGQNAFDQHQIEQGIAHYETASALAPQDAAYHHALAAGYWVHAQHDKAMASMRRAISLRPNDPAIWHNALYYCWFSPYETRESILDLHRQWGDLVAPLKDPTPHRNLPDPHRRLRIGYVSSNLRSHVVGRFMVEILRHHDHASVEVFCYFHGDADAFTGELKQYADHWIDTHTLDDSTLAARIRQDQIDILVDLTQHMAISRLLTFARKPAPIQVTYLGYPGTTGLHQMDYRFTDRFMEPPDSPLGFGPEKPMHLPLYWGIHITPDAPDLLPQACTRNGHITFGCLNNFSKTNPLLWELWCRILNAVPNSRLHLLARGKRIPQHAADFFSAHDVEPSRITPIEHRPYSQYLASYHDIDISLDTFPYNGHMTSCDSLLMGVPVISMVGELPASRGGLLIFNSLNMPEALAQTPDEYVQKAIALAAAVPSQPNLPQSIRQRLLQSPLVDTLRFTRDLESAYRQMWIHWCNRTS